MKRTAEELIHTACQGDDAGQRRSALIELGYLDSSDVFPVLVQMLDDPNPGIRHAAVISLGRYGNDQAIDLIVKPKTLKAQDRNVRWAAVSALGKLGDHHVIDHLLKVMDDSEWIVRTQAVAELKDKIRDIIRLGDIRNARHLVRLLAMDNEEIVDMVIDGFYDLGIESVPLLLEALRSPSREMRRNAARALGKIGSKKALHPLMGMLCDSEGQVREAVVEALGLLKNRKAIEPLVRRLVDNMRRVQDQARIALTRLGRLSTDPLLNALSHEQDKFNLCAIIRTLGEIGDPKAVPTLINYLRSSYFIVRVTATKALVGYGPDIIPQLLTCLSYNESNISTLIIDAVNSENTPLQLRAIHALGGLEDHRSVHVLKKLVDQGSHEVQEAASMALVRIGCAAWGRCGALQVLSQIATEEVMPHLEHSLKDDSANVRLEAVQAIAQVNGRAAVSALIEAVRNDEEDYIRFEGVRLLRQIGVGYPEVLGLALHALKDPKREVRAQAVRLLGNFLDDRSIQPLLDAMADEHWSVRESAENAILNFGVRAQPLLIQGLLHKTWTVRLRSARILGEIGDEQSLDSLEKVKRGKDENSEVIAKVQEAQEKIKSRN